MSNSCKTNCNCPSGESLCVDIKGNGTCYKPSDSFCCPMGICPIGGTCCYDGTCCPPGRECLKKGSCCPEGEYAIDDQGICCPNGYELCDKTCYDPAIFDCCLAYINLSSYPAHALCGSIPCTSGTCNPANCPKPDQTICIDPNGKGTCGFYSCM